MQAGAYVCVCYYCYNYYHHDNHYWLYDSFLGSFDDRELRQSISLVSVGVCLCCRVCVQA